MGGGVPFRIPLAPKLAKADLSSTFHQISGLFRPTPGYSGLIRLFFYFFVQSPPVSFYPVFRETAAKNEAASNQIKVNQTKSNQIKVNHRRRRIAGHRALWCLRFGASLELGAWTLGASLSTLRTSPDSIQPLHSPPEFVLPTSPSCHDDFAKP